MSEKTLDDVLSELPNRQLFVGQPGDGRHQYRRVDLQQVAALPGFILMEVDRADEDGEPYGITWWPAGMISEEIQRGVPMEVPLMFKEVRMLSAINSLEHVLVTIAVGINWDESWPTLLED